MAEVTISCMPLIGTSDGPIFGQPTGTLSELTNMRLTRDGHALARGGMDKMKPSGGTNADALSAGGHSCIHQMSTSFGWIRTYDAAAGAGSQYSANKQFSPGGWLPFPTGVANDATYFGADQPFSRVWVYLQIAASLTGATIVAEYYNGSTWGSLTQAETLDFTATGYQYGSWTMPTDWATTTVGDSGTGNILKYWMRYRISAITSVTTLPRILTSGGTWGGMREIYEAQMNPRGAANNGLLRRYGQTGTTGEWFSVASSLFSNSDNPARMASYRGRVFMVNGKDQKTWDGASSQDIGLSKGSWTVGAPSINAVANGLPVGVYRYYLAWGYGPLGAPDAHGSDVGDVASSYGVSQATYAGEWTVPDTLNTVPKLTIGSTTPPTNASAVYIYRTQDLTGVPAAQKPQFPAFLVDTLFRYKEEATSVTTAFTGFNYISGVYYDGGYALVFPPVEAVTYDNTPVTRCRYVSVYQNRLFLGNSTEWYWSDPFKPDSFNRTFNYISLNKAQGGRNMGGVEFADQMVLFTETQTWGLTNVDLDVPQLYPIHPAVGCVAPDSIVAGEGKLIWMARDGFYAWEGGRAAPTKISQSWDSTFRKLSYENHGGSRATIWNGLYIVRLANPDLSSIGACYAFDFYSGAWGQLTPPGSITTMFPSQGALGTWSTWSPTGFASTMFPLGTIYAPLGNNDAGYLHPIWGKCDFGTGAGEYGLFLGELTTQDNGTNYTCSGTMHFPLAPSAVATPYRVLCYYLAADGWQTPVLSFTPAATIGGPAGTLNTGTPDVGSDYSVVAGTWSGVSTGMSDIQVKFSATTQAGGTVWRQWLFGGILEASPSRFRRGLV